MNFDPINKADCVVAQSIIDSGGSGGGGGGQDPRCSDSDFASANPSICSNVSYLILKPQSSLISKLSSIQFKVFEYANFIESEVTDSLVFKSSDPLIFLIGVSTGSGTGVEKGTVVVTVERNGKTASAEVTVLDSSVGCDDTAVKTIILVDDSMSSGQLFGGQYLTKLDFAKAAATLWSGRILTVDSVPKDFLKVWSFSEAVNTLMPSYSGIASDATTAIASISQLSTKTDLLDSLTKAVADISAEVATIKAIVLFSDGNNTSSQNVQSIIDLAASFKAGGGIIVSIGLRASGVGFDLLNRISTGGFFLNSTAQNFSGTLAGMSFLKSSLCAGSCQEAGDAFENAGALDYSGFLNWEVISGRVDLIGNGFLDFLPNSGLYVDMVGSGTYQATSTGATTPFGATIRSIDRFPLVEGLDYTISFKLSGNLRLESAGATQSIKVYIRDPDAPETDQNVFEHAVSPSWDDGLQTYSFTFTAPSAVVVKIFFQQIIAVGQFGNILDDIKFIEASTQTVLLEDNFDGENPVYKIPPCGSSEPVSELANPVAPIFSFVDYPSGAVKNGQTYLYAVSYITNEGETELSPLSDVTTISFLAQSNKSILVALPIPDGDRVKQKRIWRNRTSGSSDLYLLASVEAGVPQYYDTETNAVFFARSNPAIVPPSANTTSKVTGELGYGYDCASDTCSQADALAAQYQDTNPLPDIEAGGGGNQTLFTSTKQFCASCPSGSQNGATGIPASVCKTATETSYVSQSDADAKALQAATSAAQNELSCTHLYTSTMSFKAACRLGNGQDVTKSSTKTSLTSQAEADALALADAKQLAEAALVCDGQNNTQKITINTDAKATPYPSVKYVSGQTGAISKVVVSLKKITHTYAPDIICLLVAPDGLTSCLLMANCGNATTATNVDLVFDDAAASFLPTLLASQLVSGTFKPTQTTCTVLPSPAPAVADSTEYGTSLSVFNGMSPNGSWALYVFDDSPLDAGKIDLGWDMTITL